MQGSVAKSTHAGIPWLRFIRQHAKDRVHFWAFDGWSFPPNRSVVAEVYPALWNRTFPIEGRTPDQQDASAITKWLQQADTDGSLEKFFRPEIEPHERKTAEIEGLFAENQAEFAIATKILSWKETQKRLLSQSKFTNLFLFQEPAERLSDRGLKERRDILELVATLLLFLEPLHARLKRLSMHILSGFFNDRVGFDVTCFVSDRLQQLLFAGHRRSIDLDNIAGVRIKMHLAVLAFEIRPSNESVR